MKKTPSKIRVALLGCGQIADAHLTQLKRIRHAEVVSVCDVHEDLAWQAAQRFQIPRWDTSLDRMLEQVQPDVVHVTTPAHTHANLAIQLLEAGCHVYVEKPFTLDAIEANRLFSVASRTDRLVCVGHDQLFDPAWLTAKVWIRQGEIGEVRHIESILGYPLDGKFGSLVAGNPKHWVRQLPGGLFQNTISHPLYRIADLMGTDQPQLAGGWRQRDGLSFPTEMNLSLIGTEQTGSLTFSTSLPPQRITRIYGTRGQIDIDFDLQTLRLHRLPRLPGAFAKLEGSWNQLQNALWNVQHNAVRFACGDIHYFAGMKTLFERFHDAIRGDSPMPIPHSETYRITLLLDRIFAHCRQATDSSAIPFAHRNEDAGTVTIADSSQLCSPIPS